MGMKPEKKPKKGSKEYLKKSWENSLLPSLPTKVGENVKRLMRMPSIIGNLSRKGDYEANIEKRTG